MKYLTPTLSLILLASSSVSSSAQEPKTPSSSTTPPAKTESARPKGEVDSTFEELKKRGEGILILCDDKCKDPKQKISGGVMNGRALELVSPDYPPIARAAHASGKVIVLVIIDKEGKVKAAQLVDGHPLLAAAAIKAARASRFSPTMLEGKPVNVLGEIVYNFVGTP